MSPHSPLPKSEFKRVKLSVAYDGTDFCGWQRQKDTAKPSIQELLEGAASKLFDQPITMVASGRTDAGVHAIAQIIHFDLPKPLNGMDLVYKLNCLTPPSIAVRRAWMAPKGFHAQLKADKKTYRYWIHNGHRPTALRHRYSTWFRPPLDVNFLQEASNYLIGEHDFSSFQTVGTPVPSAIREIYKADWRRKGSQIYFTISGDGFLKQMVRNIVGTVVELNLKKRPAKEILEILAKRDRKFALTTAPPEGLYLSRVYYPQELDSQCYEI